MQHHGLALIRDASLLTRPATARAFFCRRMPAAGFPPQSGFHVFSQPMVDVIFDGEIYLDTSLADRFFQRHAKQFEKLRDLADRDRCRPLSGDRSWSLKMRKPLTLLVDDTREWCVSSAVHRRRRFDL